jgi:energy-coupling factor transporter ATP-binding protein EcfA2
MGSCISSSANKGKIRGTLKLVLLGTQGTGKSTFHKQMKIIYSSDEAGDAIESSKMQFTANLLLGLKDLSVLLEDKKIKISEKAKLVRPGFFKLLRQFCLDRRVER